VIKRAAALVCLLAVTVVAIPMLGTTTSGASAILAGRVHERFQPNRGKIFVLVIGNDARAGNPDQSRADAVHLVGINTKTMRGGILNFPRDSWVNIPGSGTGRINEALYRGGPDLLARTVESITGIHIDYWVMTGFEGFRGIMEAIGGIEMKIPFDLYDPSGSGINLGKGNQLLRREMALAYVRTRHSFPRGDVDRTTNQARFLIEMLRKLRSQVDQNPSTLLKWMAAARRYARFDISAAEMFRLGVLASQVQPKDVGNVTVPVSVGAVGAASVVFISPAAQSIYARFKRTARL
jgi:LCP family protein required for cell wall assembly